MPVVPEITIEELPDGSCHITVKTGGNTNVTVRAPSQDTTDMLTALKAIPGRVVVVP